MTALNPVLTIGDQLDRGGDRARAAGRSEARERAIDLLIGSASRRPARRMRDYPFQFSGGMLQRALIAIALASSPRLLLADEPTTSLDVIIQDQILSLLLELQQDTGMSMILVSHDLAVISEVCDRIVVMYAGQVVEEGTAADIITPAPPPLHPARCWTRCPSPAQTRGQLRSIPGSPPSLIDVPGRLPVRAALPVCDVSECLTWETELAPPRAGRTTPPGAGGMTRSGKGRRHGKQASSASASSARAGGPTSRTCPAGPGTSAARSSASATSTMDKAAAAGRAVRRPGRHRRLPRAAGARRHRHHRRGHQGQRALRDQLRRHRGRQARAQREAGRPRPPRRAPGSRPRRRPPG